VWVGAGAALLVVLVAMFVVLAGRDEGDQATPTTQVASDEQPALSIPPELGNATLPEGDYGPMCQALLAQAGSAPSSLTPERFADAYASLDFDVLIGLAPPAIVPDLTILRDHRDEVVAMLGQVDRIDQIGAADLPAGYLEPLITVGRVVTERCVPSAAPTSSTSGPTTVVPTTAPAPAGSAG
jgi:hypothetical protein